MSIVVGQTLIWDMRSVRARGGWSGSHLGLEVCPWGLVRLSFRTEGLSVSVVAGEGLI